VGLSGSIRLCCRPVRCMTAIVVLQHVTRKSRVLAPVADSQRACSGGVWCAIKRGWTRDGRGMYVLIRSVMIACCDSRAAHRSVCSDVRAAHRSVCSDVRAAHVAACCDCRSAYSRWSTGASGFQVARSAARRFCSSYSAGRMWGRVSCDRFHFDIFYRSPRTLPRIRPAGQGSNDKAVTEGGGCPREITFNLRAP